MTPQPVPIQGDVEDIPGDIDWQLGTEVGFQFTQPLLGLRGGPPTGGDGIHDGPVHHVGHPLGQESMSRSGKVTNAFYTL